ERTGTASPHADHPTVVLLPLMAGLLRGQEADALPVADDLAGTHPDPWVRAAARLMAGLLLVNAGAAAEAHRHLRDAEARFAAIGDRWGVAQAVAGWAMALSGAVDAEEEMAALERARAAFAELGDHADVAQLTARLALGHAARGDRARARAARHVPA